MRSRFRWLWAWVTRRPCIHCQHPLTSHEDYPSPYGPGFCYGGLPFACGCRATDGAK